MPQRHRLVDASSLSRGFVLEAQDGRIGVITNALPGGRLIVAVEGAASTRLLLPDSQIEEIFNETSTATIALTRIEVARRFPRIVAAGRAQAPGRT